MAHETKILPRTNLTWFITYSSVNKEIQLNDSFTGLGLTVGLRQTLFLEAPIFVIGVFFVLSPLPSGDVPAVSYLWAGA